MSWTLSRKLYTALTVSAVLVLLGTLVTYLQVNRLASVSTEENLQADFIRSANLQLFYQTAAQASLRMHALTPDERYRTDLTNDLEKEQALATQAESFLSRIEGDREAYRSWRAIFLRWRKETAEPYFAAFDKGQKPMPSTAVSIHRDLLPAFDTLMARHHLQDAALDGESSAARSLALSATLASAFAAIAFGALIFVVTLRNATRQVQDAVAATTSGTTEIAATLTEQEQIATDQATAISEISSTMTELAATSAQATESSEAIVQRATASMGTVRQWGDGLRANVEDMASLRDTVDGIARQILELSEQTGQIGGILGTVSDVAGQTNLLALNAAVEAARAGEHGRGFAVVASEIRKLADQSKKSLERIGTMVTQIQKSTNATVMAAEQGTKRVEVTIHAAQESMGAVQSIVSTLEDTVLNTQQITLNLRQQGVGIRQVSEAIGSINAGTKENVAGMGQVRIGINQLKDMGNRLRAIVGD